tara:strand:+ start:1142 stop:1690 length:549 start_codon:yes stop_codon:yes gene_type:complete
MGLIENTIVKLAELIPKKNRDDLLEDAEKVQEAVSNMNIRDEIDTIDNMAKSGSKHSSKHSSKNGNGYMPAVNREGYRENFTLSQTTTAAIKFSIWFIITFVILINILIMKLTNSTQGCANSPTNVLLLFGILIPFILLIIGYVTNVSDGLLQGISFALYTVGVFLYRKTLSSGGSKFNYFM